MPDKFAGLCISEKFPIHQYTMGSTFVLFRASLSRQFRIHIVCSMVILVFLWLADLQCADGFLLSPKRGLAPAMGPPFNRQLDGKQFHDDNLQIGGRHAVRSHGLGAGAAKDGVSTHFRRQMSNTRSSTGGDTIQVSGISNNKTDPPDVEVEALIAFRAAITSDPSDALRSWIVGAEAGNDSDTCSGWVGVTCSPQFPYHVVALNVSILQLEGSLNSVLPPLRHLTFLQSLDLSDNAFSGSIQGELLTNFSHLSYFNLSFNFIAGVIPSEIGVLVRLQDLDLTQNNITGTIPDSLGNCSLLRSINVAINFLEGDIPALLGTLSGLEQLDMSSNLFSGSIPGALGNCSSLQSLNLDNNPQIQGTLPEEISLLKKLQQLSLVEVYISGVFPLWIGNLTSLTQLFLGSNEMRGEIPETIGQLEFLWEFLLDSTPMTGVIPLSICNLTSLGALEISDTNISGNIPPQIGMLPNLFYLRLQSSLFTGVIPSSLANCSALTVLGIAYNELMDPQPIPPWIESLTSLTYLHLPAINLQGELSAFSVGKLSNLQYFIVGYNNLTGTIPLGLQNCTGLFYLDVSGNRLTGEIPPELGVLRSIGTFYAYNNSLTGSFPEFIFNWTLLTQFNVAYNHLTGLIDDRGKFGQLQQLNWFQITSNNLEGPIPETIGNCTSLQLISMARLGLSGLIPASLGNLTSLEILVLQRNNFHGPIPVNILGSCLALTYLELGFNKLEGSIPWEIGQLVQLTGLYLSNNKFSGLVPSSLGNCSKMSYLTLSGNQFEGNVPAAAILKMSASLSFLDLSANLFSGPWPKEFGELTNLQSINVSSNNISGPIPLGLGQCVNLNSMDISLNNLTGQIPQDIGSLAVLEFFNVSFNDFTGPIPQSGIFNSNRINESSFLGNSGLCGPTATIGLHHLQCALNVSTHIHDQHCKGFTCKQIWIPISAVSTFILLGVLWTVVRIRSGWIFRNDGHPGTSTVLLNFGIGAHVQLTERDVLQAMDDPRGNNVIGVGAGSIVYRGTLPRGQFFALKKLLPHNESGSHGVDNNDLLNEAKVLANLRHKNIVKCLSFYSDMNHKALVLEYMCGGCLHKHLHEVEPCQLMWQTRLKVAMGVAEGMKYLHHDFPEALIHRDLKPSNIFLDADFEPKVGDFGISKFVGIERDGETTASRFCGTIGYMPPEYASQVRVSTKGDVYSFGIVVIELLTRKQPCSANATEDQDRDLRSWVLDYFHEKPLELLDPSLITECSLDSVAREQMMLLLRVSLFCTRPDPKSRPSMIDVVGMLTSIINLGKEPAIRRSVEELANDTNQNIEASQDPAIEGAEFGSNS